MSQASESRQHMITLVAAGKTLEEAQAIVSKMFAQMEVAVPTEKTHEEHIWRATWGDITAYVADEYGGKDRPLVHQSDEREARCVLCGIPWKAYDNARFGALPLEDGNPDADEDAEEIDVIPRTHITCNEYDNNSEWREAFESSSDDKFKSFGVYPRKTI